MAATTVTPPMEAVICIAALSAQYALPRTATVYTLEVAGLLIDGRFDTTPCRNRDHRLLLRILRTALIALPPETQQVTIQTSCVNIVRTGSGGRVPTSYRAAWRSVRKLCGGRTVTWKLAPATDERQQALTRCLAEILADASIRGPRLVSQRRRRGAQPKPAPASALSSTDKIVHHIIDRLEAAAAA